MKSQVRFPRLFAVLSVFFGTVSSSLAYGAGTKNASLEPSPGTESAKYVQGQLLVRYNATRPKARIAGARVRAFGTREELALISLPPGMSVYEGAAHYKQDPDVRFVEPNYIYQLYALPDDPLFTSQWYLQNTGEDGGVPTLPDADINAPEAWDAGFTGTPQIVVAVVDTGVDYKHEDIAENIWTNPGEIADNGIDDDGNGYIDDVHGIDAGDGDSDPMDLVGHGTHVAGIVAARGNNGVGISGVGWNTTILPCKAASGFGLSLDAILGCFEYIRDLKSKGVEIVAVNASWGGPISHALYEEMEALREAGILIVAAAGNARMNLDNFDMYPATADLPNIISVGATNSDGQLTAFSNYGVRTVDISAPGEDIMSTIPGLSGVQIGDFRYLEDVEAASAWTTIGGWARTSGNAASGNWAWEDSPGRDYANGSEAILTSPPIDLTGPTPDSMLLTFSANIELENEADYMYLEVSRDNGLSWNTMSVYTGSSAGWQDYMLPLEPDYAVASFRMRFRLVANVDVTAPGVGLDDIGIATLASVSNAYDRFSGTSMAAPVVSGLAALVKAQDPSRSWPTIRNLLLTGGKTIEGSTDSSTTTLTGASVRAWDVDGGGSLSCANKTLFKRLAPTKDTITLMRRTDSTVTLQALNINCGEPAGAPRVTIQPGGATFELRDTGTTGDAFRGDGIYTGRWIPTADENDFVLGFPDGSSVDIRFVNNYRPPVRSTTVYRDITTTAIDLGLWDEDAAVVVTPFPINIGGNEYWELHVSPNGLIGWEPLPLFNFFNEPFPTARLSAAIAPWWDDLIVNHSNPNSGVYYATIGEAPNREFVIEWREMEAFPRSTSGITFQAVFFENDSRLLFNYQNTSFGGSGLLRQKPTVGIQLGETAVQSLPVTYPDLLTENTYSWRSNNAPPTAHAGSAITVSGGSTVILSGTASSDPDGGPLSYRWEQTRGEKTVQIVRSDSPEATFRAPNLDDSYTFRLTVTDDAGAQATATVDITATFDPEAPLESDSGSENKSRCPMRAIFDATPQESTLADIRTFRDQVLKPSALGREIVALYYHVGPRVTPMLESNETLRKIARIVLTPVVNFISRLVQALGL